MFKKLLIITLSALILAGCDKNNEVTADMLVGEWNCSNTDSQQGELKDLNGTLKLIYEKDDPKDSFDMTFAKLADDKISLRINNSDKIDNIAFTAKEEKNIQQDNIKSYVLLEYQYISNDESALINHYEFSTYDSNGSLIAPTMGYKYTMKCLRIK